MSKVLNYVKRGIKYVLHEYKQPIIKVDIVQKTSNELFKDKVYLVTGGSNGLGYYIAKKLIEESAKVIITGRNEESLKKSKEELGDKCEYIVYDIRECTKADEIISKIIDENGKLDGIVNNAGISLHEWDFLKVDYDGFESQFLTNLKGSYFLTQSFIKKVYEIGAKEANIIFISSERGTMCDDLPYGLTKASINSLVQALSYKYYKDGIRVNAIAPGITASNMTKIEKDSDLFCQYSSGRYFVPEEVAEVCCFLLSDYSKCISGEVIHTNAGNHIKRGY